MHKYMKGVWHVHTKKAMKKLLKKCTLIATAAALAMQSVTWTGISAGAAADGVEINSTNFPDANFREEVSNDLDWNGDGVLSSSEISGGGLYISSEDDALNVDLTGINLLDGLNQVSIENCTIEPIAITASISSIFFYNSTVAGDITIGSGTQTYDTIELANCYVNGTLKINGTTEYIYMNNSVYNKLDLGTKQINYLGLSYIEDMTSFVVPSNVNSLEICGNDNLSKMNFSSAKSLTELYCYDNFSLESLDLRSATKLEYADVSGNALSSLNVKGLSNLYWLDISYNLFTSFDLSVCPTVEYIFFGGNIFTDINLSALNNVYGIGVQHMGLTSLDKYKKYFPNLRNLNCSYNSLRNLDLSQFPNLTSLNCTSNLLSSLDISNSKLRTLRADYNNIKTLNAEGATNLDMLYLRENLVTELDLSDTQVGRLYLSYNPISKLALPTTTYKNILYIYAEGTKLNSLDLPYCDRAVVDLKFVSANDITTASDYTDIKNLSFYIGDATTVDMNKLIKDFDESKLSYSSDFTVDSSTGILTTTKSRDSYSLRYKFSGSSYSTIYLRRTVDTPSAAAFETRKYNNGIVSFYIPCAKSDYVTLYVENAATGESLLRVSCEKNDTMKMSRDFSGAGCTKLKVYTIAYNRVGDTVKSTMSDVQYIDIKSSVPVVVKPTPTATAGDGQVTLTWNAIDGATKYAVTLCSNGKYYVQNNSLTDTSYTVTGLTNGTTYQFLVQAYVGGKWTEFTADDLVSATPISTKPQPKATAGDGQVTLNWNAVSGATKYAVTLYSNGKYYVQNNSLTATTYTVSPLTNGKTYQFLVQAYIGGKWSAFTTADFVSATPSA